MPDIYQGTEIWDFSLVDPDNRRSVDYDLRQQMFVLFVKEQTTTSIVSSKLRRTAESSCT